MKQHFPLQFPIEADGRTYTGLDMRRPKVRDLRAMERATGSDSDRAYALIGNLAEVSPQVIDELDPADLEAINDWLEPILDPKGLGSRKAGS